MSQPPSASNVVTNSVAPPGDTAQDPTMWIVDRLSPNLSFNYGFSTIYTSSQTPFQHLLVAHIGAYGRALFLDGLLQTSEGDEPLYHEPIVHSPCLFHGCPTKVLILGGADGGAAREALRWNSVCEVVVVDIDAAVVDACRVHLPSIARGAFEDPRVRLVIADAADFVANTQDRFEAIICDLTDPGEDGPSCALFTVEFFTKLQNLLTPRGALCIQSGPASLCESATIFPRVFASLRAVFRSVLPMQVFVPTYASPLALTLATDSSESLPTIARADRLLKDELTGEMQVLDGRAFHGLFAIPRFLRNAVEKETHVFTSANTKKPCNGASQQ